MSSRSTNEVKRKEDEGYLEQKNLYWREELLSVITQPKQQKDFDDKNYTYTLEEKTSPSAYYQEYKTTSDRAYQGDDAKDEEVILYESHFDYII